MQPINFSGAIDWLWNYATLVSWKPQSNVPLVPNRATFMDVFFMHKNRDSMGLNLEIGFVF